MQNLAAIFFDFDGVLFDSVGVKTDAFYELFKPFGEDAAKQVLEYHLAHGGISRYEKIRFAYDQIIHQPLSEEKLDQAGRRFSELVKEKVINSAWIKGAKEFLEAYSDKTPCFVISGTPEDELIEIVRAKELSDHFIEVLGSPVKKPAHVETLLEKFGYDRSQCLFIGDAMTDFNAAKETKLKFIGIGKVEDFPAGTKVLPNCEGLADITRQLGLNPDR